MSATRTKRDIVEHRVMEQQAYMLTSGYFMGLLDNQKRDFVNSQMFESQRGFIFDDKNADASFQKDDDAQYRLRFALSINRNLQEAYGYQMDSDLLKEFAKAPGQVQIANYDELEHTIRESLGIDQFTKSHLFYKNFPEEVMNMDEAELYLNACVYYGARYGMNILGFSEIMREAGMMEKEPVERSPLIEAFERETKIITNKSMDDFHDLMNGKIHGLNLSKSDRDACLAYASTWKDEVVKECSKPFLSKENEALMTAWLHNHHYDNVVKQNHMSKDATDILRVISVLSSVNGARNGKVERDKNFKKVSVAPERLTTVKSFEVRLDKKDKAFVKSLMNDCKNIYRDVWRDASYWKKVMRNINPKTGPDRVVKLFDNLHDNKKIDEKGNEIKSQDAMFMDAKCALKEHNAEKIVAFAKNNPGYFMQKCINVFSITPEDKKRDVLNAVKETSKLASPVAGLKALNAAMLRNDIDAHIVRDGTRELKNTGKTLVKLDVKDRDAVCTAIANGLKESLKDTKDLGKVYIDPALNDIRIPQRQDSKASRGATVSTGSMIPGDKNKNLVAAGISWKTPHLDLDLHAMPFTKDENGKLKAEKDDEIAYYHLKPSWGVHSGDLVEGDPYGDGKGAQEVIMFDKRNVQNNYDYIVFELHGFNANLANDDSIRAVFMEREGDIHGCFEDGGRRGRLCFCGEVVEEKTFSESIHVTAAGSDLVMFAYDTKHDNFIWLDEPILINGRDGYAHTPNEGMAMALQHALNSPEPTMGELFTVHAAANRAEIVTDMRKADTVFTYKPIDAEKEGLKETATLINSFDTDTILNEFCERPKEDVEVEKEAVPEKKSIENENVFSNAISMFFDEARNMQQDIADAYRGSNEGLAFTDKEDREY